MVLRCLPTSLLKLRVANNQLLHIVGLEELAHLQFLDISHNAIEDLNGLQYNSQLRVLKASFNKIRSVEGLEPLVRLETYVCVTRGSCCFSGVPVQAGARLVLINGDHAGWTWRRTGFTTRRICDRFRSTNGCAAWC